MQNDQEYRDQLKRDMDEMNRREDEERDRNRQWGIQNNFPQLKNTLQYQIVFELYQYEETAINEKSGNYIHFEFEGSEYIFRDLALHNEKSEYGCDFYWVEFHTYHDEQEEEYVNPQDLEFSLTAYKAADVQRLIDDPTIEDGPLGFGRAVEDLEMLETELPYDSELPKKLLEEARKLYTLDDAWAKHILKYHLGVNI